ncbi:Rieske 2Fe-2S domain-containing protein [Mangrovicoccus sp. HB161399]|uniref:aromatic ring-hydroxylating dioxygenase subunit alpha n=1 Tax=Mangrovicoccus sp. HB161399 TaxID=2720392 RepID=UPI001551CE42|nr:Rieske 2Fe-2S domain-containing protein [Mangrovicoccus sp. HB161399]
MTVQEEIGPAGQQAVADWRNGWQAVSFLADLEPGTVTRVTVHGEGFALFRGADGAPACVLDRCPHRAARLSDGRVVDGHLECLYHGWCFDPAGRCSAIPQLLPNRNYPPRADVRGFPLAVVQGVIWIWPGDPALADEAAIPRSPELEAPGIHAVTFQIDLPYDQGYLIENAIDIAHVHVAHHGLRGGGHRSMAKPILFDTEDRGAAGFTSAFRSVGLERAGASPVERAEVSFVAPGMLKYRTRYRDAAKIAGLDLISLPLGPGRCRLLYRKFSNFNPARERRKPRWMEHLTQCAILEQDMALVIGQHAETERLGRPLRELWMPLNTSDPTVIAYRRWVDRFGRHLPHHRGYDHAASAPAPEGTDTSRAALHLPNCLTCRRLVRRLQAAQKAAAGLVAAALVGGLAAGGGIAWAALVLLGIGLGLGARMLEGKFR